MLLLLSSSSPYPFERQYYLVNYIRPQCTATTTHLIRAAHLHHCQPSVHFRLAIVVCGGACALLLFCRCMFNCCSPVPKVSPFCFIASFLPPCHIALESGWLYIPNCGYNARTTLAIYRRPSLHINSIEASSLDCQNQARVTRLSTTQSDPSSHQTRSGWKLPTYAGAQFALARLFPQKRLAILSVDVMPRIAFCTRNLCALPTSSSYKAPLRTNKRRYLPSAVSIRSYTTRW